MVWWLGGARPASAVARGSQRVGKSKLDDGSYSDRHWRRATEDVAEADGPELQTQTDQECTAEHSRKD